MKPITMFTMASCPYCKHARKWMEEALAENPEYRGIEITIIDEVQEPGVASRYDYWYVPTYYIGDEKSHEGAATKDVIRRVFAKALAE